MPNNFQLSKKIFYKEKTRKSAYLGWILRVFLCYVT